MQPEAIIVRTSDRINFKKCRRSWDIGSKIRQNYEPNLLPVPLTFGTAIHAGLETYYNPDTWNMPREVVQPLAILSFIESCEKTRKEYLKNTGQDGLNETMAMEYDERIDLGKGMLANYFVVAPKLDGRFTPRHVELEFEVPILVPSWFPLLRLPPEFSIRTHVNEVLDREETHLYFQGLPVVYQGRLDSLWEDDSQHYWIVDHKTAANFGGTQHLDRDEQCGSYMWALRQLGIRTQGVIYNELAKTAPRAPDQLKKGGLSKNKQQNVSFESYLAEIRRLGLDPRDYQDFLDYLKTEGKQYIRRTEVPRSQIELDNLGDQIFLQAIDMFNDPLIYPNASKMNCNGCMQALPCLALNDGSDYEYIMKNMYHKREEQNEELVNVE